MNIYELFSDTDTKVPNGKNSSSGTDQADHVGHRQIKRFMHAYQVDQTIIIVLNDKNSSKKIICVNNKNYNKYIKIHNIEI